MPEQHDGDDVLGFSLDASRFTRAYPGFAYEGSLEGVVARLERNVPHSVTAKGAHASHPKVIGDDAAASSTAVATTTSGSSTGGSGGGSAAGAGAASIPCPVCGSHHLQEVLDLRSQPLANDFKPTAHEAMECERFPLRLMRCRSCQHMHLSQVCSRSPRSPRTGAREMQPTYTSAITRSSFITHARRPKHTHARILASHSRLPLSPSRDDAHIARSS